jgi:hypothetical protein
MPEFFGLLLLFFFLLSIGLFVSLGALAFGEPSSFIKLVPGLSWFLEKAASPSKFQNALAYGLGTLCLGVLVILSFLFGSFSVTFAFNLWSSPLYDWLSVLQNF